ncbi:hypothetical protein HDU76_011254, partial [Blyttiomyces sp. JEL0837]
MISFITTLASLQVLIVLSSTVLLLDAAPVADAKRQALGAFGACFLEVPQNPLTAQGLSSPWFVYGNGCNQVDKVTLVECTILDRDTGALSVYIPLVVNGQNQQARQAFIPPVTPTLPKNNTIGCFIGTTGVSTTLVSIQNSVADGKCVNGDPRIQDDIFGQFAVCNGKTFFKHVQQAIMVGKIVNIPPLGM